MQQYQYPDFRVEPGTGAVLLGEVSQCSDDNKDIRFNPPVVRFPEIQEDEPARTAAQKAVAYAKQRGKRIT